MRNWATSRRSCATGIVPIIPTTTRTVTTALIRQTLTRATLPSSTPTSPKNFRIAIIYSFISPVLPFGSELPLGPKCMSEASLAPSSIKMSDNICQIRPIVADLCQTHGRNLPQPLNKPPSAAGTGDGGDHGFGGPNTYQRGSRACRRPPSPRRHLHHRCRARIGSPGCEQPRGPGGPVREWRESWALHPRDAATTVRTLPEASVDRYIDLTLSSDRLARTSKPPVPTGCVP